MSVKRANRRARLGCAVLACLLATAASAQVKIGKAKSIGPLLAAPDGRLVLFYGSGKDGQRVDSCVFSPDGNTWSPPIAIPRFSCAAIGADGTIYIPAYADRSFVLDTLAPSRDGWELRKDAAKIHTIGFKGQILGPTNHIALQTTAAGEQIWVTCAWREDEPVAGKNTANHRFAVFHSPAAKPKFELKWEDKEGFAQAPGITIPAIWGDRLALYAPQHYSCALATHDGARWQVREKLFDWGKRFSGWVGAYGAPLPRMAATANGFLHIAQFTNGNEKDPGGTYLLSLSPGGGVTCLEIGSTEKIQFLLADGDDVLLGMKYAVTERIDDLQKKYENLYIVRCAPDATPGGKYRKIGKEIAVSDSQSMKGDMVAAGRTAGGIPTAWLDEGTLYFRMISETRK